MVLAHAVGSAVLKWRPHPEVMSLHTVKNKRVCRLHCVAYLIRSFLSPRLPPLLSFELTDQPHILPLIFQTFSIHPDALGGDLHNNTLTTAVSPGECPHLHLHTYLHTYLQL